MLFKHWKNHDQSLHLQEGSFVDFCRKYPYIYISFFSNLFWTQEMKKYLIFILHNRLDLS